MYSFKALPSTTSESVQNQAKRSGKRGSLLKAGSKAGGSGHVDSRRMSNTGMGAKKRDGKGSSRATDAGGDETRYQVEEARLKGIDSDYYEIFPDDISTGRKVCSPVLTLLHAFLVFVSSTPLPIYIFISLSMGIDEATAG